MSFINGKIDNLPSNNHDKNQMLEDVHEIIFSGCVVLGQRDFRQILLLLHVIVLISNVPTQWFSEVEKEISILANEDKTGGIGVKLRPDLLKMLTDIRTHKFVLSFCCLLESLQNDCDKKSHKDGTDKQRIGEEEDCC